VSSRLVSVHSECGCGYVGGDTSQNRELSTSSRPVQLLTAKSGVVDEGSFFNIIVSTLAGLVIGAETPRISLPISSNGDGVIGLGCCVFAGDA